MSIYKLGNLLGWITIVLFAATIANYIVKLINRNWGKQMAPAGKRSMAVLTRIFVRNHRYFGFGAFTALFLHLIIQLLKVGLSISGIFAAALLILQVFLGAYATVGKKPRKGMWFAAHRIIALLLIVGIAFHLLIPAVIRTPSSLHATAASSSVMANRAFTLNELSKYNGQNGQPAYIAYKGIVYDVSNVPQWKSGTHHGEKAGTDVTNDISRSPHGDTVFADLPQVGTVRG